MALIHLIYVSTAPVPASAATLEEILAVSSRNNERDGVTGMLLYAGGTFMQVLEGEDEAVDATHQRIERDARHTGVILLERAPISERSFSRWSMGYRRISAAEAAAEPAYAPFFSEGFEASAIGAKPGAALAMLKHFAVDQRERRSR